MGLQGGLVVALVSVIKREWAPVTTPLYAALEGMLLGVVSPHLEILRLLAKLQVEGRR